MTSYITASSLYDRALEVLLAPASSQQNQMMHEALVLCCHEGLRHTQQAFGNLFAQVDFLCNQHGVAIRDKMAIQTMRRHSNRPDVLSKEDLLYDVRALCLFVSAVFSEPVPDRLVRRIPTENKPQDRAPAVNYRYMRCIVTAWTDTHITATTEQPFHNGDETSSTLTIDYSADHLRYLQPLLQKGMQLNLLDIHADKELSPALIIIEPDFLIDISRIAASFKNYGRHPLNYTVARLSPPANSQAIMLGNFAGQVLDDVVHGDARSYQVNETIRNHFRGHAIDYVTCPDFVPENFIAKAHAQAANIIGAVDVLFPQNAAGHSFTFDRQKAVLEPSFLCEQLGISGRVDLMTTDFRLLVEQKSGKNWNIEHRTPNAHGSLQQEDHYVQLLLYYGVLRHNFHLSFDRVSLRLLYSKFPAHEGLIVVSYLQSLFRDAIMLRNLIVAWELHMARHGFESVIDVITPKTLNQFNDTSTLFVRYQLPQLAALTTPLHQLSPLERSYFCRMMTHVYREQRVSKLGSQEVTGRSSSDVWNMPLSEKMEMGNIFTRLRVKALEQSAARNGFDIVTLSVPDYRQQGIDFLPNFRTGDIVNLYAYDETPDAREALLFRATVTTLHTDEITLMLNNGLQNPAIIDNGRLYAVEMSEQADGRDIPSLYRFITAPEHRRRLLLAQRPPRRDAQQCLSRAYHPDYDPILLQAKQALDYFLLIGPPGTGKTSMALRYLVEEELASPATPEGKTSGEVLLLAYTNRAVDEICGMLREAGVDYLRIGREYSCNELYRDHLLGRALDNHTRLTDIRRRLTDCPVIVGTTATIANNSSLFRLKHFSLVIVDEASQILEPSIIGLLSQGNPKDAFLPRFILIGDHKQLPAVVQQSEQDCRVSEQPLLDIGLDSCSHSLFERLIRTERAAGREQFIGILRKQGRMHPDIAEWPNKMFYSREQLQPVPLPHQQEPSGNRLLFFPSTYCKEPGLSDKVNPAEARIVVEQLKAVYEQYQRHFNPQKTVGVIVPYRNQIAVIRREIEKTGIKALEQVSIDTVERYQGSQRDVIIYSFTVQSPYQLEFLTANTFVEDNHIIDRKLNVALTRARRQLIITGHEPTLRHNPLFASLIDHIKEKGGYQNK